MFEVLEPPGGSRISVSSTQYGTRLQWENPSRPLVIRIFTGFFLIGWLGFWTIGGFMAIRNLFDGKLSLVFWLLGWLVGECAATYALYLTLRPTRPETLVFDNLELRWGPGYDGDIQKAMNRLSRGFRLNSKATTIRKQEIDGIVLERLLDRQRLSIEVGVDRIEIGRFLTEREQEWLHGILLTWLES